MESVDSSLAHAVRETLKELDLPSSDAALSRLAELYAKQLDAARAIGRTADKILIAVRNDPASDMDFVEAVSALRNKLTEQARIDALGPKLLTTLDALGATPKARAAASKGGGSSGGDKPESALSKIRAARTG